MTDDIERLLRIDDGELERAWERSAEAPAGLPVEEQERLLKWGIVRYFDRTFDYPE